MITTLKQDSKRFELESAQRLQHSGQRVNSMHSTTSDNRQTEGQSDESQLGYALYGMNTPMDDYENYQTGGRTRSDQGSRTNSRTLDTRQGQRQQLPIGHDELPASRGYPPEPAYPSSYNLYPFSTSAASEALLTGHADLAGDENREDGAPRLVSTTSHPFVNAGGLLARTASRGSEGRYRHPGWDDTPNFQNDTARG